MANRYLGVVSASVATFAVTNIDDAFLLTLFFARRIRTWRILVGQYVGFSAIVGISLIGAWFALAIPHRWVHFLGVLPLAIGIRRLWQARCSDTDRHHVAKESVVAIALLTLSNGADNISLYMPFFVIGRPNLLLILVVYAALVALWCIAGGWLGKHPIVLGAVDRWGHWAVPSVFVGLGIYVLTS